MIVEIQTYIANNSPREKVLEQIGVEETFLEVVQVNSIFESKYTYQLYLFSTTLHQWSRMVKCSY